MATPPTFPDAKDLVEGTGNRSFASVTTQAGDYLMFSGIAEDSDTAASVANMTPSDGVLTWTKRADAGPAVGSRTRNQQWTALDATGGTRTVLVTLSPVTTKSWRGRLTVVRGSGGPSGTGQSDTAQTVSVTRTGDNSAVFMTVGDWSTGAVGSPAWTPGGATTASQQGTSATYIFGRWDDSGAAGTASHGISSPSYTTPGCTVVEMLGVAGGAADAAGPSAQPQLPPWLLVELALRNQTMWLGGTPSPVQNATAAVAGAGATTAIATQAAGNTTTGAGTATAPIVITATASATGAGTVTALAAQSAAATAAGAGSVSPLATQAAGTAVTGAGSVTANPTGATSGTATVAGAGSTAAAAAITASATITGAGSASVSATARATATAAGAGSTAALATQAATSTVAGSGSVAANSGAASFGTATITGAGTVSAAGATLGSATTTGAGAVTALARIQAGRTVAGAGSVTASAGTVIFGTATVAGLGAVTANPTSRITPRPYAGTTGRPSSGTTARPSAGTTARPGSGTTIRPFAGTTTRP